VLLCRRHHDLVHHSDWQIQMIGGLPVFRPPAFIDAERKPRTNQLHRSHDVREPEPITPLGRVNRVPLHA
jgi:hypothetical protein